MAFVSLDYIVFLPIVVLVCYIIPSKIRYIWLLAASYFFYMNWNALYAILLLSSTLITYISGFFLDKINNMELSSDAKKFRKNITTTICTILNLGILFAFKYLGFAIESINRVLNMMNRDGFSFETTILLPVGISFYTFQAIGYVIDVYRGDTEHEKNFFKYALFVSFFPQLVAGPIERSKNLLKQLNNPIRFDYDRFRDGIMLMLWGYYLKMVIADRAAIYVDTVYDSPIAYPGVYLLIATVLFGIQIYCDFAGYSCIAIGSARILGIDLMTNFRYSYLSESVQEFWRNWHISLNTWFRDYLYIPLGGNRKGKVRQYINLMIVFLLSGLWHGANWTYVVWGGLNGLYQIISRLLKGPKKILAGLLRINTYSLGSRIIKVLITFVLVDTAWIFFRVNHIRTAIDIIASIIGNRNYMVFYNGGLYECGLDSKNFALLFMAIVLLLIVDILNKRGMIVRDIILRQDAWFRCITVAVSIAFILLFGIWGSAYDAKSFIYFQF
ncbi:MAG: MBOAT family protein [Lachnospiraceae bacterium]|nr:MBOAT family protein [Lachnospiraceae bacterium]